MITCWNVQIFEGAGETEQGKYHIIEKEGLPYRHITIECGSWEEAEQIRQRVLEELEE